MAFSIRHPTRALLGLIATSGLVALAFVADRVWQRVDLAWALVIAALLVAVIWQRGVILDGAVLEGPAGAPSARRRRAGLVAAALGAALLALGSGGLLRDWAAAFDRAWLLWLGGTALLGWGLDAAWARWDVERRGRRWPLAATAIALVGLAATLRLATFVWFPAPYSITQVEELQVGAMGMEILSGRRIRWEYLSQAWLGALGITLGGPTLLAVRLPATVLSILKILPFFLWLRFAVGTAGAVAGSLLLAVSAWDVLFARLATNHNLFVVAAAFALLAGPARRGRPSAYVWLGLLSGYVCFEYVLYRPLAAFALAGAFHVSLRDRRAMRWQRWLRPLLALAVAGAMILPLYSFVVAGGRTAELFDGWRRAQANRSYYSPVDSWSEVAAKRLERSEQAAALFFFRGARSPMWNPDAEPLVDPFTSLLLVLGAGYALAHPLRQLFGLTLAAAVFTVAASLVATGNFDFVRAGATLAYVYALAGFGAAGLWAALAASRRAGGRVLAAAVLALGLGGALLFSVRYLHFFVTSPDIRQAQFRELAYLAAWIGGNTSEDERLVFVGPNFPYMLEGHDASWLRGRRRGAAVWDIRSALLDWSGNPEPARLLIYSAATTADVAAYLDWLAPALELQVVPGPLGAAQDMLAGRSKRPPPALRARLVRWSCQPVALQVELQNARGEVLTVIEEAAGLIDPTTWPGAVQAAIPRHAPDVTRARARFSAAFRVEAAGDYLFSVQHHPGSAVLSIDGAVLADASATTLHLAAGTHHIELVAEYDPRASAPVHRLFWRGPDSDGRLELLPFYRVGVARCPN